MIENHNGGKYLSQRPMNVYAQGSLLKISHLDKLRLETRMSKALPEVS